MTKVSVGDLLGAKLEGRKLVGVVAWDYQMARIADRVGVDIVSVGDSVGTNLWGRANPLEMTLDEMIVVCRAVRSGVKRALLSCDFPYGPLQEGPREAVRAALRLVKEGGADMVKLDGAADFTDGVAAVVRAGIPVFAQFGITPQTALRHGVAYANATAPDAVVSAELANEMLAQATALQSAGAVVLDFTNSGPIVGPAVVAGVSIPVMGGFGGGPWLDGRVRMAHAAIGYAAEGIDEAPDTYANVARIAFDALSEYANDVRGSKQIRGQRR